MEKSQIILASSSPRRQLLIQSLGIPFEVVVSDVNEETEAGLTPEEVVQELALRKATAVHNMLNKKKHSGVVIGADTIVVLNQNILGKPVNEHDAFHTLKQLQGKTHHVYSSIACLSLTKEQSKVAHRVTEVTMKSLTDEEINNYIKTGEPMDKAGSYGIQGLGGTLIDEIKGDYFNVVGLSLVLLTEMLKSFNIKVL